MSLLKKKVFAYVDECQEDIVDFLCEYIEFKSVTAGVPGTGQELAVQNWLRDQFKAMGFGKVDYWAVDPEKKRPNIVATIKGIGGGKPLIFNGHSDVVPVPESQLSKWTVDPWKPKVKDGMVYGRGSCDMKGGNTAMIWAAKALIDNDVRTEGDVYVECVVGEETSEDAIGVTSTIDRGYTAPFAIVGEPTNCEIHTSALGYFLFELTILGKETHLSSRNLAVFPQRYGIPCGSEVGVDAIEKAIPFIELFQRLEKQWNQRWRHKLQGGGGYPRHEDYQGVGVFTINPSFIEAGTYKASLPGHCKLTYHVHYPPWLRAEEVWNELKRHVDAVASTDDWLREHPPIFKVPAMHSDQREGSETPIDHEGCKTLAKAFKEATGEDPIFSGLKCCCDSPCFSKRGIPVVIFGPGDLSMGTHGIDEHVPIDHIIKCCKTYAAMAIDWCS